MLDGKVYFIKRRCMKILIMGYVGKRNTGIGRTLIETVKELTKLDDTNKYIICTNYDNEELRYTKFKSNVKIITYKISRNSSIRNLIFNSLIFPFFALRERVDLVYIPNFALILFTFKPIVSVIHDMIEFKVDEKFSWPRMVYRKNIVPRMAKISRKIITVSNNSKKDILELCGVDEAKIEVIYDAVSNEFDKYPEKTSKSNSNYILYVGTVDFPGKNVHGVIKAFELFKNKSDIDLKLIICGMPGKGFEHIEQMIKESVAKKDILYKGYVTDEELVGIYKNAKCFLFMSFYEGFGLPVLEAMKMGVPVITSNCSSLPEVAGNAAILCDPADILSISEAIEKIITDDKVRNNLVEMGHQNIKRFSWESSAQKTLNVFKSVLNSF